MSNLYRVLKVIASPFIRLMFRLKVEGEENIPKEGGVLICPNHISNWDPILLGVAAHRQIHYMAKVALFKYKFSSKFMYAAGAFPVRRGLADPTSLKTAINYIKDGNAVGMYPQGQRHIGKVPKDTKVLPGVGMIAYRSGADVVPVAIKTEKYKIIPFRKVYIKIGKPIPNSEFDFAEQNRDNYINASNKVFDRILELLEEIK